MCTWVSCPAPPVIAGRGVRALTTHDGAAVDTWLHQLRADVAEPQVNHEMALLLKTQPLTFIATATSTLGAIEQFLDA